MFTDKNLARVWANTKKHHSRDESSHAPPTPVSTLAVFRYRSDDLDRQRRQGWPSEVAGVALRDLLRDRRRHCPAYPHCIPCCYSLWR